MIGSYVLSVHYIFYITDRVLGERERESNPGAMQEISV